MSQRLDEWRHGNLHHAQATQDAPSVRQALVARRAALLGSAAPLFYRRPIQVAGGYGAHLLDADGSDLLDAYNNVAVVGHANPRVRAAVDAALGSANTHTRYVQEPLLDYLDDLLTTFGEPFSQIALTCSGSEANDVALRLAEHVTGATGVIVADGAYHGSTALVSAVSPALGDGVPLAAWVRRVPAPDGFRHGIGDEALEDWFSAHVRAACRDLERHGHGVRALLVDSIFASDGILPGPPGFLAAAAAEVRAHGGMVIADEVQPGFGRLGTGWWGFQRHGLLPDVVTLGKPMANGLPLAGAVVRDGLIESFGAASHYFNTFAGNPASVAAGHAVLKEIMERDLITRAGKLGSVLVDGITSAAQGCDAVAQVRGAGLFIGVEIVGPDGHTPNEALAVDIVNRMRERNVLISVGGAAKNVLKIRPPLVLDDTDSERLLDTLASVLVESMR